MNNMFFTEAVVTEKKKYKRYVVPNSKSESGPYGKAEKSLSDNNELLGNIVVRVQEAIWYNDAD